MAEQTVVQTLLFPTLCAKPLVATFDTPHQSSDGGAIPLKAIDDDLGLTARLAACLPERRQAGKIEHDLPTLIRQRCFGLACGYADANDAAQLKADPIHKLLVGRDPITGPALASQPTLSRFENAVGPRELYRLTQTLESQGTVLPSLTSKQPALTPTCGDPPGHRPPFTSESSNCRRIWRFTASTEGFRQVHEGNTVPHYC